MTTEIQILGWELACFALMGFCIVLVWQLNRSMKLNDDMINLLKRREIVIPETALHEGLKAAVKLVIDTAQCAVETATDQQTPVPYVLYCPECGMKHIDEDEWATRPHKTHQCLNKMCKHEWRPYPFPTVGVLSGFVGPGQVDRTGGPAERAVQAEQGTHPEVGGGDG